MKKQTGKIDAGTASLDHYKQRLPPWRHSLREALLPIIRTETPYVALLQERMRNPVLDSYFAMTANLGTHTCFMLVLPILFWCGNSFLGRGMTTLLAAGVYFSGFVKDMLCLPRPLSPPLTRITMSGSAALEYGFPSSHSTNAVSVAAYAILLLRQGEYGISQEMNRNLQILACFYAFSIVLGRLYCGMHGFFDVIIGSLLGLVIGLAQFYLGPLKDEYLFSGTIQSLIVVFLVIAVAVRIHPEPADNCPCFDDSVAFVGVVLGIDIGAWHFSRSRYTDLTASYPSTVPFSVEILGWPRVIARILLGVVVVFLWRAVAKPTLLRYLPPIFRVIENWGLDLPRRFFKPASQYQKVPYHKDDDNVIPSARSIPSLVNNIRRRRAISVGPQSEADAYEALAYRKKKRRDSLKNLTSPIIPTKLGEQSKDYFATSSGTASHLRRRSSSLEEFRAQMGATSAMLSPNAVTTPFPEKMNGKTEVDTSAEDEMDRTELFATVHKPRVRYDVEVVTKLVVYVGIGWLAVEGSPILFHHIGLGIYQ